MVGFFFPLVLVQFVNFENASYLIIKYILVYDHPCEEFNNLIKFLFSI